MFSFNKGDSLQPHNGYKFSTKDQDNDIWAKDCVAVYPGGWWFYNCHECNLNGSYYQSAVKSSKAVSWYRFGKAWVSLKSARMMIRSKAWCLNMYGNYIYLASSLPLVFFNSIIHLLPKTRLVLILLIIQNVIWFRNHWTVVGNWKDKTLYTMLV